MYLAVFIIYKPQKIFNIPLYKFRMPADCIGYIFYSSPGGTKRLFSVRGKQKRAVIQPFSLFHSIFTVFLIYKHGNSMQFPCLYHIPRFSTAFSVKLIYFSPKSNNILHPFTFPLYTITETPNFCMIVYFCLIVQFSPQSPHYQRHPETRKSGVHHPL